MMNDKENTDRYSSGRKPAFPIIMVVIGFLLIPCGLLLILSLKENNIILGSILFLSGCVGALSRTGFEIDFVNKRLNNYNILFLFYKMNRWTDISGYAYTAVLRFKFGTRTFYGMTTISVDSPEEYRYHVFLLSESHRHRLEITLFQDQEEAVKFAHWLGERLEIEYDVYNPETSRHHRR